MFHISLNSYTPFFQKSKNIRSLQISASQIYSNLLTDTSYATLFCASSPSNFSHIHGSGYVPRSVHGHRLQIPPQIWHFCPSRCMGYSPIFHTAGSLRSAYLQSLFQEVFSGKPVLCIYIHPENLICLCFIGLFFHKADFSCKYRKYQTVSLFFMPVV